MKRIVLSLILIATLSFNACCFAVNGDSPTNRPKSFTEVSEESSPAVVSIRVKASLRPKRMFNNPNRDYQEPSTEDFWQHFFGVPHRSQPQQQQAIPQFGQGSGFIISPDGYILTNNHVVRDAEEILVILNDNSEYEAKVVGEDPQTDLAVIKIEANNLPFLKLGDSDELKVGQWVIAIGTPLGLQASVSAGIVSAKGRNNLDLINIEDFIQTDAATNRGNSGGPLINLDGEVIGINTALVTNMGTGGHMGIGFAIPSNIAQHIVEQIISTGEVTRGFMGVTMQRIDQDLASAFGMDKAEGALVADVAKGSPAEKAGIKQGDIIVKYNNQKVNNITALRNSVALKKPGAKVNLTVKRNGKIIVVPIQLGAFPTSQAFVANQVNKLGFEVENLTPEIARTLGLINDQGVIISKVEPGSPAAWAGIKKGALLIAINQKKVNSIEDVRQALSQVAQGKPVLLLIKMGDITRFVSLKVN